MLFNAKNHYKLPQVILAKANIVKTEYQVSRSKLTSSPSKSSEINTRFTYKRMFFVFGFTTSSLFRGPMPGIYKTLLNSTSPCMIFKETFMTLVTHRNSIYKLWSHAYLCCEVSISKWIQEFVECLLVEFIVLIFFNLLRISHLQQTPKKDINNDCNNKIIWEIQ